MSVRYHDAADQLAWQGTWLRRAGKAPLNFPESVAIAWARRLHSIAMNKRHLVRTDGLPPYMPLLAPEALCSVMLLMLSSPHFPWSWQYPIFTWQTPEGRFGIFHGYSRDPTPGAGTRTHSCTVGAHLLACGSTLDAQLEAQIHSSPRPVHLPFCAAAKRSFRALVLQGVVENCLWAGKWCRTRSPSR